MGQMLFIVWRESVEALLVVGILYAWLKNSDPAARKGLPYLWGGVAAGVLLSVGLAFGLQYVSDSLDDEMQLWFQIAMLLVAAVLIVQMVIWMRRHGRNMRGHLHQTLETGYRSSRWWGVFLLVMLAIAREGSEMAIFLYGMMISQSGISTAQVLLSVGLGIVLALLTFWLVQLSGKLLSWRVFFAVTEIVLLFLASALFLSGAERLLDVFIEQSDTLAQLVLRLDLMSPLWDTSLWLNDAGTLGNMVSSLTGYRARPVMLTLLIQLVYWVSVVILLRRTGKVSKESAA